MGTVAGGATVPVVFEEAAAASPNGRAGWPQPPAAAAASTLSASSVELLARLLQATSVYSTVDRDGQVRAVCRLLRIGRR